MRLGILHVERDILHGLTARELLGWEHYAMLEPFDETRADYRAASIATMIANVNRGKDHRAYTLEDFVLKFGDRAERKRTPEDQLWIAKMYAAAAVRPDQDISAMVFTPDPEALKAYEEYFSKRDKES